MTTTNRVSLLLALSALATACASRSDGPARIGAAGGVLSTASGITLTIPAGAFARETEVRLVESAPRDGAMTRVALEPAGLALATGASLAFKVEDGNVRVSEIEHGPEGEIRHRLESRRHGGRGEVEVQVEHLAEVEVEHGLACADACGTGLECDDGVCKAHVEDDPATHDVGDDHGVDDPATHDVGDDHGGGTTTPQPGDDHGGATGGTTTPPPATPPVDDKGNDGPGHG